MAEQVEDDLDAGAWKVIIEARDSGRGVGIYDEDGRLKDCCTKTSFGGSAPWTTSSGRRLTSAAAGALVRMGPNANFGNVQPAHVMSLEAMRVGLRGDTLSPPVRETPLEGQEFVRPYRSVSGAAPRRCIRRHGGRWR